MKLNITLIALLLTSLAFAQDYYAISTNNGAVTINYPSNTTLEITDEKGTREMNPVDIEERLEGNFTVAVSVPWSAEKEVYNLERESISIELIDDHTDQEEKAEKVYSNPSHENPPKEIHREVVKNSKNPKLYDLEIAFSNDLTFKITDGKAVAFQNGATIDVKNKYLVYYAGGVMKISFDQTTGETWYVFEKN